MNFSKKNFNEKRPQKYGPKIAKFEIKGSFPFLKKGFLALNVKFLIKIYVHFL